MTTRVCPPRALTVAGSDSGGGAGIQADLKTFHCWGCFGMSAVTALTAQNSTGVSGVYKVSGQFVAAQMEAVLGDMGADALKCGMLSCAEVVEAVADVLSRYPGPPLVLDTVLVAKSGDALLEEEAVEVMVDRLFPRAALVTPNTVEAHRLTGIEVKCESSMREAAECLQKMGASGVLIKGGHLEGDELLDLLVLPGGKSRLFTGRRIHTSHTHGTGCTLSAATTAGLAKGMSLSDSVAAARDYLQRGIANAHTTGSGYGTMLHEPFRP
jgi:hydroxymethylpyrimidine/phosphomethylpyrimidine kinase